MPITPASLYIGHLGTAASDLTLRPFGAATVPANTKVIVKQFCLVNVADNPVRVDLSHVPSGGSAGVSNRVLSSFVVPPRASITLDTTLVMEAGDKLNGQANAASTLTLHVNGMVWT